MKKAHAILSLVLALTLCVSTFAQSLQNNTTNQLIDAGGAKIDQPVDSNPATSTYPVAQRAAKELLIQNATILTASRGTLKNSSILVRDGKIAAVGANLKAADPNAKIIDATGKFVIPGIIDAHSHTGGEGGINEGSLSVTSMTRTQDIIDPYHINIYRQLAGGLVTVNLLHGSANAIGGQNAILKLKKGKPAEEWLVKDARPGIKFALGENPKRSNSGGGQTTQPRRYPATRMGVEETIREAFVRAKDYLREWEEYEAKKGKDKTAIAPRRDLQLDAIVEILQGKRDIHSHCYREDEILMLLSLAGELGFKVKVLQHVLEGYKVAKEIAAHGAGGSSFADSWAYKLEAYDAIPYNTALMSAKGVLMTVNSDSDERARRLYLEAAKGVKYGGMSEEAALRTITLNAAIQLGIDKRTGSIDVGKDADLVIFSAHPFSVYTVPETTIIEGEIYFDRKQDVERRAAIKKEKEELVKRERELRQRGTTPPVRGTQPQPMPGDQEEQVTDHDHGKPRKKEVKNDQ
jgi:imidazolonepropionase-like amidohydrolase